MKHDSEISEQQLNAFIDNQLDPEERAQILEAASNNPSLAKALIELRHTKELVNFAYLEPPIPNSEFPKFPNSTVDYLSKGLAAGVILAFGVIAGWTGQALFSADSEINAPFESVTNFDTSDKKISRVILHISTPNKERIEEALDTTERILENNRNKSHKVQLEVIANADGLNMLRKGSAFTQRVSSIVEKYDNASFLACGVAMENARLKEGTEVQLIPAAKIIPAALERILTRLEHGWMYIKG